MTRALVWAERVAAFSFPCISVASVAMHVVMLKIFTLRKIGPQWKHPYNSYSHSMYTAPRVRANCMVVMGMYVWLGTIICCCICYTASSRAQCNAFDVATLQHIREHQRVRWWPMLPRAAFNRCVFSSNVHWFLVNTSSVLPLCAWGRSKISTVRCDLRSNDAFFVAYCHQHRIRPLVRIFPPVSEGTHKACRCDYTYPSCVERWFILPQWDKALWLIAACAHIGN